MKRVSFLLIFLVVLLFTFAVAENISDVIPSEDLWGVKANALTEVLRDSKKCKIENNEGYIVSDQTINSSNMDVYYVFGKDMGTYSGLSKIVYIITDDNLSKEDRKEYRKALVNNIKEVIGNPDSETDVVTTWKRKTYKIEIGTGQFKKYKNTDTYTVGVLFTGLPEQPKISERILNLYHSYEKGDKGNDIKNIQLRLAELGYLHDQADGIFGNNTKTALEAFQTNNDLTPNGIASRTVQAVLFAKGALSSDGIPSMAFNPNIYSTHTSKPEITPKPTPKPTKKPKTSTGTGYYVGNIKTKKFHIASCSSVNQMKEKNKKYFDSRDEALSLGYVPCKKCNP